MRRFGFLEDGSKLWYTGPGYVRALRCPKASSGDENPGSQVLIRSAFEGSMFVRVGAGECAIILVLVLILVIGIAISIRMRGD